MSAIIIITIVLYMIMTIGVGVYFSKKGSGTSSDEFFLGGRKMGPIVTAMSAEASDMSSWLLMGLPGLAYISGLAEPFWTALGLAVGTYLNYLIVAKRIRVYSERLGAITIPEYFSKRYKDNIGALSAAAAVIIVIFFVPYTASGFKAVGTLFNSLFGLDYHAAMIIGAAIIIIYTVMGGFKAVSTTDLIQSIFMTVALIAVLIFGVKMAGGMSAVIDNAKTLPGYFNVTEGYNISTGSAGTYSFLTIVSTMAWGLGYFAMPHILVRFMAIEDKNKLKISRRVGSIWVVISMGVAVFIGVVGLGMSANGSIVSMSTSSESETVIIKVADLMSQHGFVLAVLAGITLAGILACTMSTADSQLLAASSSVAQDLLQNVFHIKMSTKASMMIARITVVLIAVIAVILAWDPNSSVFRIVSFAWAGFGASFGPVVLLSLFWKRSNKWGAFFGIIAGGAGVFVWKYAIAPIGGVFAIYELLPAFIFALIVNVVVSLATEKPDAEITALFDECKKG